MRFICWVPLLALALAGCRGAEDLAVEACVVAVAGQLGDRVYTIDRDALAASLKKVDARGDLTATVTFNPGLPNQLIQTFYCEVQYDPEAPGVEPAVTSLRFQW